ncbi:MAG: UDP-N-acetylmuramate dehydrogenase [Antricoccus sp.]
MTLPPIESVALAELTSMRVGGPGSLMNADSTEGLIEVVAHADAEHQPLLLIGGGSNLVVADTGWDGIVGRIANRGVATSLEDGVVVLDVAAGEPFDDLVAHTVAESLSGIECLSGIPGLVGATPIQNVGAYGAEIADVVRSVDVWDRQANDVAVLPASACGFGYRSSVFKGDNRYVVLGVRIGLHASKVSAPIRYAELARTLGVEVGQTASLSSVRDAVLSLRRSKGMVLDDIDPDTWSCGSFFTNPILAAGQLPEGAPRYPYDERVKTSAAWLIEHAGFAKGYRLGGAALSSKHTLAITNRGGASAADILALAREIRAGVQATYDIELHPEPLLIGCSL